LLTDEQRKAVEDYKSEIFKPKMAGPADIQRLQDEVDRLKRNLKKSVSKS